MTSFEEYIAEVASRTLKNGGSASRPSTCIFLPVVDLWCFPKYPAKTVILPSTINLKAEIKKFISVNEIYLGESECWLGTWVNPKTGDYYLDVATGFESLAEAQKKAAQLGAKEGRKIVALFNPKQNQTVFL